MPGGVLELRNDLGLGGETHVIHQKGPCKYKGEVGGSGPGHSTEPHHWLRRWRWEPPQESQQPAGATEGGEAASPFSAVAGTQPCPLLLGQ